VLAHLRRAVDEAVTGRGRLVMVTGEAGIGKTTLLAYAARYAESAGLVTVWGHGWPGQGAPAYWPWAQVLRGLGVGQLPDGPVVDEAPASARFQKFDTISSLVLGRAEQRPLLVLLDDLQWADVPSLLLLDLLSRRLPTAACVVVGSHRDVDRNAQPALSALAARGIVLPLSGLSEPAVGELARRLAGHGLPAETIAAMHQRTGGNPFFVEQLSLLTPDAGAGVPPGVREVLDQRLAANTTNDAAKAELEQALALDPKALGAVHVEGLRCAGSICKLALSAPSGAEVGQAVDKLVEHLPKSFGSVVASSITDDDRAIYFGRSSADISVNSPEPPAP